MLSAEVDYYCLQEMSTWLNMEIRKNSAFIEFCQDCTRSSGILYIAGDVLLLYEFYMNDEERQSYLDNHVTGSQINRLKLRLRQDRFKCMSPEPYVNTHEYSTDVILIERFSIA